ncbi:MAG: MarR family transcriptional regulator [Sphingomonas sp.]|nr:MarR family transcriptional regulator [Sphingomonas sp.]
MMSDPLTDADFAALFGFRYALRRFLAFSAEAAGGAGLTPQQHQALLAIRAGEGRELIVGALADRLLLRPHSATELVDRMEKLGLVIRTVGQADRRQVTVRLTRKGEQLLNGLSEAHRAELRRLRPLLGELMSKL